MRTSGKEIIRDILQKKDMSQARLAERLGISRSLLNMRIKRNSGVYDISATLLAETVEALGYKLVVVPSTTLLPMASYEVESEPRVEPKAKASNPYNIAPTPPTPTPIPTTATTPTAHTEE